MSHLVFFCFFLLKVSETGPCGKCTAFSCKHIPFNQDIFGQIDYGRVIDLVPVYKLVGSIASS